MEDSPEDNNFLISLPYSGLQSQKLKLELTSLLNKYSENIKFKIVLVNKQTIGGLFQYKDTLDKGMASAVVYKYCCPKCRHSLCWFHLSEVGHSRCRACRSQCSYWSSLIQPFTFSYQRTFPFLWWSSGLPVSI